METGVGGRRNNENGNGKRNGIDNGSLGTGMEMRLRIRTGRGGIVKRNGNGKKNWIGIRIEK